ncbi:MAG: PQQ-binding-like beta-propeller repeat protein [Planctomycetota bacterium]
MAGLIKTWLLARKLGSADEAVRLDAVGQLVESDNPQACAHLVKALEDDAVSVRSLALTGLLGCADYPGIVETVARLLHDPSTEVRRNAIYVLTKLNAARALGYVLQDLTDPDWTHQLRGAELACHLPARQFTDALCNILNRGEDLNDELRARCAEALGKIRAPEAVDCLVRLLGGTVSVKKAAATALGQIGDTRAVAPLCELLMVDPHDHVMQAAALALGSLGDSRAEPVLTDLLEELVVEYSSVGSGDNTEREMGLSRKAVALALEHLTGTPWSQWGQGDTQDAIRMAASKNHLACRLALLRARDSRIDGNGQAFKAAIIALQPTTAPPENMGEPPGVVRPLAAEMDPSLLVFTYYRHENRAYGPYRPAQLHEMVEQGRLKRTSPIYRVGEGEWEFADELPGLFPRGGASPECPGWSTCAIKRGDHRRTGVFPGETIEPVSGIAWQFRATGIVGESIMVANRAVYAPCADGRLYVLDAESGQELWRYDAGAPVHALTVADDLLVMGVGQGRECRLFALDPHTGEVRWDFHQGPAASPIVEGERIYYGTPRGSVYCVNRESGRRIWVYNKFDKPIVSPVALADGRLYFGGPEETGSLNCLQADNGELVWDYHAKGPTPFAPTVVDDTAYIGSASGRLAAVDIETGLERWSYEPLLDDVHWSITTALAVTDGKVIFGCDNALLYAVDAERGTECWRAPLQGEARSSPVVVGKIVVVADLNGSLLAVDPSSGRPAWHWTVPPRLGDLTTAGSSPYPAAGKLYIAGEGPNVYAFG